MRETMLRVAEKLVVAEGVVTLTLAHPDGERLPDWAPGAHVDVLLPGGTRQYSLCGDRWDAHHYRVGVLRERGGRGGSAHVHDELAEGDLVGVGGPRNNFGLVPAGHCLFVAGGIGITPLLPMLRQAEIVGAAWHLLYGGRSRATMGFLDELAGHEDHVEVVPQDDRGLLDLDTALADLPTDARVYVCGPPPLLDAVESRCAGWAPGRLRTERFVAAEQGAPVRHAAFEVELARSGLRVTVDPGPACSTPWAPPVCRYCPRAGRARAGPASPPSLLLEADPPHHDAPRAVLAKVLGPRALHRLRQAWFADAEALVEDLLGHAGPGGVTEVDAVPALAEVFPLRVFPDAVGLPDEGRENLLPYRRHRVQRVRAGQCRCGRREHRG